jgi:hypothetical protein
LKDVDDVHEPNSPELHLLVHPRATQLPVLQTSPEGQDTTLEQPTKEPSVSYTEILLA